MLRSGGHDNDVAFVNRPALVREYRFAASLDEGQNLIRSLVSFLPDLASGRNAHENELRT